MSSKGKEIAGKPPSGGKRKRDGGDSDKWGGRSKKDRAVLRFFEDTADVDGYDDSDDSDIDNFFLEEELDLEQKVNNEPGKSSVLPFFPKEEELEEELDKMMEEHYRDGSGFVTFADENYETKRCFDGSSLVPCAKDPTIWKVKCMVGRERHSAFCLMQKFVDLKSLGTKLLIISAFSVEHIKGFIYIEADKHGDIVEACKGLCSIYATRVAPVPLNEVSHLLSVRSRCTEISEGMWARVKNGKYKGDLAQVVAVNDARKRATVKLIPRVDLQAMAQKFGGGLAVKRGVTPAPRLISSSELEEFRPLIQYRRDRETGKHFEFLDGLMLKDGYLYKRASIDSLSFWGVMASEEELMKFRNPETNESQDLEWLTQLYGDSKRKKIIGSDNGLDKGFEKGEGSSGVDVVDDFAVHSLVCFGRKEFGLIVGKEKDDHYKILTEGKEGPVVVPVEQRMIKKGPSDMKFTALDQHSKAISVGDKVRVLEGPLKDRQGIVKQIYRGTIFMQDEIETENGGYICAKSQMCEKVKISFDASKEKGCESGNLGFEDFSSSPKSSLSPKKPWQERESNPNFNQGDKDGAFSIGQTVRIRIGPLKGYLCRVLATRRSDVTVKLDSQQKILTVRCEHLSEIRGKTSAYSLSEDAGSSSFKPFDQLGTDGNSGDWMGGAGTSAGGDGWNAGGQSTERSPWPSFPASGFQKSLETDSADPSGSANNDPGKEVDDTVWGKKVTQSLNSPWGATVADDKDVANEDEAGAWGTTAKVGSSFGSSDGWNTATVSVGGVSGSSKDAADKWDQSYSKTGNSGGGIASSWGKGATDNDGASKMSEEPWGKGKTVGGNPTNSWDGAPAGKIGHDSWSNSKDTVEAGSWGKNNSSSIAGDSSKKGVSGWSQHKSWDKGKDVVEGDESIWRKPADTQKETQREIQENPSSKAAVEWSSNAVSAGSWGNTAGTWDQPEAKGTDEASGWKNAGNWGDKKKSIEDAIGWTNNASNDQAHSDKWSKPKSAVANEGSSWSKQGAESSWSKRDGGSSWGSQAAVNAVDESKKGDWSSSGGAQLESGWSKKSSWNAGSCGANQESGWGKKSSWTNESGDAGQDSVLGGIESQSEASGDRPGGGRWEGSFGGRDGLDRGGFRGRGDRGGFRGRGDRGGFRGRGRSGRGGDTNQESGWARNSSWNSGSGEGNQESGSAKKSSWSSGAGNANQESGGAKNSSWNSGSGEANQESGWTKKSSWSSGAGGANQESGGANNSSWNSGVGEANQESGWSKKSSWSSGAGGANPESGEAKNSSWNSGSGEANQESGWAKKSSWSSGAGGANQESGGAKNSSWNSGSGEANQESGWAKKSSWSSGAGGPNQESGGAKNSSWNPASGGANQESGWAKKSSWNNESGGADQDSVLGGIDGQSETFGDQPRGGRWGGGFRGSDRGGFRGRGDTGGYRGRGGSGRGGEGSSWSKRDAGPSWGRQSENTEGVLGGVKQDSGWAKNSSWNSESAGANQESGWANKSSWKNQSGDAGQDSVLGRSESQLEAFGDRPGGGRWGGGFGGRGGSDRGGFRGRGDRGGYRGRGSSDRGGYGGRGRSDEGGNSSDERCFNGRSGADRGRSGGRGWERREQSGDWNGGHDSGEAKTSDWSKGAGNNSQSWKNGDSGVSWNKEGGGGSNSGPGWNPPAGSIDGANNVPSGSWSKKNGSTSDPSGNQGGGDKGTRGGWNSGSGGADNRSSGWNSNDTEWKKPAGKSITNDHTGGWNKGTGSVSEAGRNEGESGGFTNQQKRWNSGNSETSNECGGWNKQGSGWSGEKGLETSGRAEDQSKILNQSSSVGQASGWNQPKEAKEGSSGDGQVPDSGKPATSSWGGKGGW